MEVDVNDTPGWFGTAHAEAARAAYDQNQRNHGLIYPWEQLPINAHNDWVLIVDKAVRAYLAAFDHSTLRRVLKRLENDEIEFLLGEFSGYGDREGSRIIREFARIPTADEEEELYGEAEQCQDELEIRRHGRIVTDRVTREML